MSKKPAINPTRLNGVPYCPLDVICPSYLPESRFHCAHWDPDNDDDIDSYVCFEAVREMAKKLATMEKT